MVSYGMAFTTLISTAALASHSTIRLLRSSTAATSWTMRRGASASMRRRTFRVPCTPTSVTTSRVPGVGRTAATRCQIHTRLHKRSAGSASPAGVQVVAYDQDNGMYASRLWWMLRWLGHDAVAVLDGGFAKWKAEGRPTKSGAEPREPREFSGSPRSEMAVGVGEVASQLGTSALATASMRARPSAIAARPSRSTRHLATSPARRIISSSRISTSADCSAPPRSCARG